MSLLLALYILILPLQFALSPVPGVDLALSRLCALAAILIFAAISLARRSLFLPRPSTLLPLVSFLAIISASYFWSENHEFALRKMAFLWNFLPLFIVFSAACRDHSGKQLLIRAIALSGALAGTIGILQSASQIVFGVEHVFPFWTSTLLPFFLGDALGGSVANYPSLLVNIAGATVLRASAFFPDPHMLSLFLGLALPIAALHAFSQPIGQRALPIAGYIVILVADLLTFSRGGYVGLAAGAIMVGILALHGRLSEKSLRRILLGGTTTVIITLSLVMTPVGTRFLSSFSSDDGSNSERLRLWQEAAGHIAARPLTGTGIGNYVLAVKPSAGYREPIYAHSLYLDIAVETGLIGLTVFLVFLSMAAYSAYRSFRRNQSLLGGAALVALIIFSAHSLFELPLFSVHVLPLFLVVLALASSEDQRTTL